MSEAFDIKQNNTVDDTHFTRIRKDLIGLNKISAVLDVGANVGHFAQTLRQNYAGPIYSLEPGDKPFKKLKQKARSDTLWKVYPLASSSSEGLTKLYTSANHVFNSLHTFNADYSTLFGKTCLHTENEETECVRLDCLFKSIRGPLFLKTDTQGHDLEVLKGAKGIIAEIEVVQVELAAERLYNESATMIEVEEYLLASGFQKVCQTVINFSAEGKPVEYDALFTKQSSRKRP